MLNSFKLSLQYILPKLWLTRLAGWGASKRAGWLTKLVIDLFVKYYKVDMKEAQKPDTASYRTFNDFFVRPLRDDVRPINTDPNVLVMPADGVIKDPVSLATTGPLPNNGNSGSSNDDGGSSSGCTVCSTPSYDLLVLLLGMSAVAAIRVLRRRNEQ